MPMSEPLKVSISPKAMSTEWCTSPNGGQRKPANNSPHPNPHSIIATINWKFFFMISLSFSPRGPHEMRDLVGRAEALSALTTTVGQCTKLPNARTKMHNATAVDSCSCFLILFEKVMSALPRLCALCAGYVLLRKRLCAFGGLCRLRRGYCCVAAITARRAITHA